MEAKKSRLSIPIELRTLPAGSTDLEGGTRPVDFNLIQINGEEGPSVSGHASFTKLRKEAIKRVAEAIQFHHDQDENFYRWIIGCGDGTILYVSWRYGVWTYDIMGPGRKGTSSNSGPWKDHREAIMAAKSHAEDYGGVAWEHAA